MKINKNTVIIIFCLIIIIFIAVLAIPENPIMGLTDWEVCDYNNKNIWYRTITEVYEPPLPLWTPEAESGIYDIRPCKKNNKRTIFAKAKIL
jgi:hypothetical protein